MHFPQSKNMRISSPKNPTVVECANSDLIEGKDLASVTSHVTRHAITIGSAPDGAKVQLEPYGHNVLLAAPSDAGKSSLTTMMAQHLAAAGYQYCLIDPEGDFENMSSATVLGGADHGAEIADAVRILEDPIRT